MEEKSCHNMDENMKDNIKTIIENSFNNGIKDSLENRTSFINNQLEKIYPEKKWMIISIRLSDYKGYSYHGKGALLMCYYKNRLIIVNSSHKNNSLIHDSKEFEIKIKKVESIVNEQKSKLEKIIIEKELLQKAIKEKEFEINNLKKEMQLKKDNNSFNKTFYAREEMMALNFLSTDSKLHYAIPCLNKDLFVDVEKKLYDKYPEYKEKNNNFLSQGNIVLKFKTVGENRLESGIPIVMQV